jgi:ankyrin repeat protein
VNAADADGWTALMLAATDGDAGAVQALLAHPRVAVSATRRNGWTALMFATTYGHAAAVQALLAHPGPR